VKSPERDKREGKTKELSPGTGRGRGHRRGMPQKSFSNIMSCGGQPLGNYPLSPGGKSWEDLPGKR